MKNKDKRKIKGGKSKGKPLDEKIKGNKGKKGKKGRKNERKN